MHGRHATSTRLASLMRSIYLFASVLRVIHDRLTAHRNCFCEHPAQQLVSATPTKREHMENLTKEIMEMALGHDDAVQKFKGRFGVQTAAVKQPPPTT